MTVLGFILVGIAMVGIITSFNLDRKAIRQSTTREMKRLTKISGLVLAISILIFIAGLIVLLRFSALV